MVLLLFACTKDQPETDTDGGSIDVETPFVATWAGRAHPRNWSMDATEFAAGLDGPELDWDFDGDGIADATTNDLVADLHVPFGLGRTEVSVTALIDGEPVRRRTQEVDLHVNVLITSFDGLDWNFLDPEWPNLVALPRIADSEFGTYAHVVLASPSQTAPSHAMMLTGYDGETNRNPDNRDVHGIPLDMTVFERARLFHGDKIAILFVSNKPEFVGVDHQEPFEHVPRIADFVWSDDLQTQVVVDNAIAGLETVQGRPFLFFFHVKAVDYAGHSTVCGSDEYQAAIREDDEGLNQLLDAIDAIGELDRTIIYSVTDHGFQLGTNAHHEEASRSWLATNDGEIALDEASNTMQTAWTLYDRLGVPTDTMEPPPPVESYLVP